MSRKRTDPTGETKQQEEERIRRPSISSLDEYADRFMDHLLIVVPGMSAAPRERVRVIFKLILTSCLRSTIAALEKGAKRGMDQTMWLMLDPDRNDKLKARRAARAQKTRDSKAVQDALRDLDAKTIASLKTLN